MAASDEAGPTPVHSTRRSTWASLPPDLVQHTANMLEDEDRLALMHACRSWHAAVLAAPGLVPTAVVCLPAPDVLDCNRDIPAWAAQQMVQDDALTAQELLSSTAWRFTLLSGTPSVRVEAGDGDPPLGPLLLPSLLLLLPSRLRRLELACPCVGPLLPLLARLSQLTDLRITGNGAQIMWAVGPSAALRSLTQLRLDYRQKPELTGDLDLNADAYAGVLPSITPARLAAASRLHSLELRLEWSCAVPRLCSSLPALRHLSLHLYECTQGAAEEAAGMCAALLLLASLSLAVHAHCGTEETYFQDDYPLVEYLEHGWVRLPPLAGLERALTALHIAGAASLPPNWRQLIGLQRLRVDNRASWALPGAEVDWEGWQGGDFSWGDASLAGLAALTRIELSRAAVLPDASLLATAPSLAEVIAPWSPADWQAELARLCPGVTRLC